MIDNWIHLLQCGLWCFVFLSIPTTSTSIRFRNHLETRKLHNRFFAIRHGQSEANLAKVIASNPANATTNYGLSQEGQSQAKTAGQNLVQQFLEERARCLQEGIPPPAGISIVSSDFLRARQTAEALMAAIQEYSEDIPIVWRRTFGNVDDDDLPQCVTLDVRLRERWFGEYDGTSDSNYNCVWAEDAQNAHHTCHGVESVWSVLDRATEFVCDCDEFMSSTDFLSKKNGPLWIVCVAHGDVLQILQTAFCGMDPKDHRSLEHLETAILRPLEQE